VCCTIKISPTSPIATHTLKDLKGTKVYDRLLKLIRAVRGRERHNFALGRLGGHLWSEERGATSAYMVVNRRCNRDSQSGHFSVDPENDSGNDLRLVEPKRQIVAESAKRLLGRFDLETHFNSHVIHWQDLATAPNKFISLPPLHRLMAKREVKKTARAQEPPSSHESDDAELGKPRNDPKKSNGSYPRLARVTA
jgi:hypothetical protein